MTTPERLILTMAAAALILGIGYVLRAIWQARVIEHLRHRRHRKNDHRIGPALMYFRTEGCAPCKVQETQIRDLERTLAAQGQEIRITSHDAVAEAALVQELHIVTVPTTVLLAGDGRVMAWNPGLTNAQTLLKQVRPLLTPTPDGWT